MDMVLSEMAEAYAKEICSWRYEGIYSVYNYPDWQTCRNEGWAIAVPEKRKREYCAVLMKGREKSVLVGELRYSQEPDKIILGLGLHPDYCGKGHGNELMGIAIQEYKRRFPGKTLELDVRPFNERAQKCYLHNGFVIIGRNIGKVPNGETEFIHMKYVMDDHK